MAQDHDTEGGVRFDPAVLRTVADLTSAVAKEMTFMPSGDGMRVTMVDPSHTMICDSTLDIPSPMEGGWAVDISRLRSALTGKEVIMSCDGALVVGSGHMVSRIPLMEPEPCPKVPSIDWTAHATILASDLRTIVRGTDPKKVQFVTLSIDGDGVKVESRDDLGYGTTLSVPPEECVDLTVEVPAKATFGTDMMQRFLSNVPADAEVMLDMSKDYPMRISLAGSGWTCQWVCAPVIRDE